MSVMDLFDVDSCQCQHSMLCTPILSHELYALTSLAPIYVRICTCTNHRLSDQVDVSAIQYGCCAELRISRWLARYMPVAMRASILH